MTKNQREFDVIVWGATGFTGRLVAEYLNERHPAGDNVRWAMAGRNAGKLGEIAEEIGAGAVPLVVADAADPKSLGEMARQTRAIITTVGPYQKYGEPLVEACAAAGTDYVDLSGEPPFMRKMIDTYSDQAAASGARIVHSCGFDSIPFDLGVYYVQQLAEEKFGKPAREVKGRVLAAKGGASGGTVASALATLENISDPFVRRTMRDIYSLAPDEGVKRPRQPDGNRPHYDRDAGKWVAPFIMAAINARNVHRSNMLMDYAYGEDFKYSEMMAAPNAPAAFAITGGLGGFAGALAFPPSRALMKSTVLPKPGDGPNKAKREAGFYKILFVAKNDDGETVKAIVEGDRDPGYGSTSKLIAESALCLAFDVSREDAPGGVTTPAAAMGDKLIERLQENAGLTFEPAQRSAMKSFDFSAIKFRPMPGLDGVDAFILDIDDERGVIDALFRFAPDAIAPLHNHLAQTNMFILVGALKMYHANGSVRETRPAGTYYRGKRDDAHLEGGGPDGAVVFYSIRRHGPEDLVEVLDEDGAAVSALTLTHVRKMLAMQK